MLPVCSATACCSCQAKVPIHGEFKSLSSCWKTFDFNCSNFDKLLRSFSNGIPPVRASFGRQHVSCFYSNHFGNSEQYVSMGDQSSYHSRLNIVKQLAQSSFGVAVVDESLPMINADGSTTSAGDDQIMNFITTTTDSSDALPNYAETESVMSFDGVMIDPPPVSDSLSGQETNVGDIVSKMNGSTADIIGGGEKTLNSLFDTFTSSVTTTITNANQAVNNITNEIISFLNQSEESAGNKLTRVSIELKEASGRVGVVALDVLRRTIIVVEDSLVQGGKSVGYAYSSAKEFLPLEVRGTLSLSEESITKVLNPAGTTLQQVYKVVEGFEKNLGLDPNDPLIPFVFFIGLSTTLWGSYRVLKHSGYAGDLSPQSTLELLQGNKNVVLVDIRPENLRESDGIPDLRRTARFRYASVALPEIDGSVRKLLKGGRDVEDSLLASVIRNLKIVGDGSKVLVMDADGTSSKGVARSLRKLGTKRPYLVQGGFCSWVKDGCRIKMLKPETALTILNEEAEAILEEINPTPLKFFGLGVGFVAAAYSLIEWEKMLQFIGVIGIGQTIYRRVASYQDAEDLKQDVRLLLAPARLGGKAITWASSKLEPNRNGLPTSPPSSSDIQSRVLQAAAKHESQPSDVEEASTNNENVNISEA